MVHSLWTTMLAQTPCKAHLISRTKTLPFSCKAAEVGPAGVRDAKQVLPLKPDIQAPDDSEVHPRCVKKNQWLHKRGRVCCFLSGHGCVPWLFFVIATPVLLLNRARSRAILLIKQQVERYHRLPGSIQGLKEVAAKEGVSPAVLFCFRVKGIRAGSGGHVCRRSGRGLQVQLHAQYPSPCSRT